MKSLVVVFVGLCLVWQANAKTITNSGDNAAAASIYYAEINQELSEKCYEMSEAEWEFATDINEDTESRKLNASKDFALYEKQNWENIRDEFPDWKDFQDPDLLRKFKELTFLGAAALPEDKLEEYNQITLTMEKSQTVSIEILISVKDAITIII